MLHFRHSPAVRRRRRAATALAVAVGLTSIRAVAGPDDSATERRMQAQSLFEEGQKYAETDPKSALGAFRASYEVEPDYRVLYSIGLVCVRLSDAPCATRAFEWYLREGGGKVTAKRRKEIEAHLKTLLKNVGALTLKSVVKDGEVRKKEDSPQAPPPSEAPAPPPAAPVAPPAATLAPVAAPPTPSPSVPPINIDDAKVHAPSSVPIVPWVVTGALAAGTVFSAVLLTNARTAYDDVRAGYPITREELDASYGRARDLAILTSAVGGATLVSFGLASYLTFFRTGTASKDRTVGIAIAPSGVSIHGRLP